MSETVLLSSIYKLKSEILKCLQMTVKNIYTYGSKDSTQTNCLSIIIIINNFFCFSDADGDQTLPPPPPPPPPPPVQASDDDQDLLTCGQCSRSFPLAHILAFIQHKQGDCHTRSQAPTANATPPSPASLTQQRVTNSEPAPGFIELRRGARGEETGMKVGHRRPGEWR